MRQCGFTNAGHIFDQQMATCQQAYQRLPYLYILAHHDLTNLLRDCMNFCKHEFSGKVTDLKHHLNDNNMRSGYVRAILCEKASNDYTLAGAVT